MSQVGTLEIKSVTPGGLVDRRIFTEGWPISWLVNLPAPQRNPPVLLGWGWLISQNLWFPSGFCCEILMIRLQVESSATAWLTRDCAAGHACGRGVSLAFLCHKLLSEGYHDMMISGFRINQLPSRELNIPYLGNRKIIDSKVPFKKGDMLQ